MFCNSLQLVRSSLLPELSANKKRQKSERCEKMNKTGHVPSPCCSSSFYLRPLVDKRATDPSIQLSTDRNRRKKLANVFCGTKRTANGGQHSLGSRRKHLFSHWSLFALARLYRKSIVKQVTYKQMPGHAPGQTQDLAYIRVLWPQGVRVRRIKYVNANILGGSLIASRAKWFQVGGDSSGRKRLGISYLRAGWISRTSPKDVTRFCSELISFKVRLKILSEIFSISWGY